MTCGVDCASFLKNVLYFRVVAVLGLRWLLWHVGSSWTWDEVHVPCIGRQILYHWITREVLLSTF